MEISFLGCFLLRVFFFLIRKINRNISTNRVGKLMKSVSISSVTDNFR